MLAVLAGVVLWGCIWGLRTVASLKEMDGSGISATKAS